MSECSLSCSCPFCAPRKISLCSLRTDQLLNWRLWLLIVLLVSRVSGGAGASLRKKKGPAHTPAEIKASEASIYSQKVLINASVASKCATEDGCTCIPIGKCRQCSRLDLGRRVPECLVTGFKQLAHCTHNKRNKYISCHYKDDPRDHRMFWLFEGAAATIATIAYSVVYLRQKRIEKIVSRRIQQQINA